ncbi:MAG: BMP family protein [Clostridiales Family XIII bacterium]|jgi:basic membrane protein A|nr:BMP family protein [Clostridiales Family XIII bacterium]
MKRWIAVILAVVLVLALAGCGSDDKDTGGDEAKTYKIAMVMDSSISDGGWGTACYSALVSASEDLGWEVAYTDSIKQSDYVSSIESYCQLGYDMIFLPGNQYSDATVQVAADYPDIAFVVLNGAETLPTDNIVSILPNADQIGYIAGVFAGLVDETNVIGFIGGMELDTTLAKLAGYTAAAQAINPDIEVLTAYAGSFDDSAKGMELAKSMIDQKADVFFGDASAVDSGARQAIDTANGDGAITIYDIGQPADILGQNPCVIGSVVTDNAGMLKICMQDLIDGNFGNKVVYGSLENDCLSLGALNEDLLSAEVREQIQDYVAQIEAGTFPPKK